MTELKSIEVGFAIFLPAMDIPEWGIPWENNACSLPIQAPGVIPTPPVIPKVTDKFTCANVRNDCSVKIGGNHDVELRWIFNQLHRAVVNDHFFIFNERIFFGNASGHFQKQTVNQFHDIGLVNDGDFLSSTEMGELKGVLNQSFRIGSGGDFE